MTGNTLFAGVAILVVAAHLVALGGLLFWGRGAGVLALNIVVAVVVLAYQARRLPHYLAAPADGQMLAFLAFEVVVLGLAIWAFGGARVAAGLSYAAAGLHLCAGVAVAVFALTFRMTRLM